jgi:hypothetical protein
VGFNPDQPRDDHGRWASGGSAAGGGRSTALLERADKLAGRAADVAQHGRVTANTGRRVAGCDQVEQIIREYGNPPFGENGNIPELDDTHYGREPSDPWLAYLGHRQGFDAPPRVGSTDDLDAAIKTGGVELWRGVTDYPGQPARSGPYGNPEIPARSAGQLIERMRSGPYEPGTGIYGNGYYFSTSQRVGEYFASVAVMRDEKKANGRTVRAVLDPQARVIDYSELNERAKDLNSRTDVSMSLTMTYLADPGRLATAMGYDAIRIVGKGDGAPNSRADRERTQYVVLNRTALLVEKDDR